MFVTDSMTLPSKIYHALICSETAYAYLSGNAGYGRASYGSAYAVALYHSALYRKIISEHFVRLCYSPDFIRFLMAVECTTHPSD